MQPKRRCRRRHTLLVFICPAIMKRNQSQTTLKSTFSFARREIHGGDKAAVKKHLFPVFTFPTKHDEVQPLWRLFKAPLETGIYN